MKLKNKGNNLSLLGLLGLLGVIGTSFAGISFLPFALFFFFLTFINVPADEMFWQHVHKAGLRALIAYAVLYSLTAFYSASRAAKYQFGIEQFDNPSPEFMEHLLMGSVLDSIIFMITVCVFMFTLMYFIRKEKKGLDMPEVDAHAENQA